MLGEHPLSDLPLSDYTVTGGDPSDVWGDACTRIAAGAAPSITTGGYGGAFFSALVAHGLFTPTHGTMASALLDPLEGEAADTETAGAMGGAASRVAGEAFGQQGVDAASGTTTRAAGESLDALENVSNSNTLQRAPALEGLAGLTAGIVGDEVGYPYDETPAYLPFNGTSHYAYAADAANGISSAGWSLLLKVVERLPVIGGNDSKRYARIYDADANSLRAEIDVIYQGGVGFTGKVFGAGFKTPGGVNYAFELSDQTPYAGADQVLAISHRNVATLRADQYNVAAGATLSKDGVNFSAYGTPEARTPLHVAIAAQLTNAHAPVGGTYGAVKLVACVLVEGTITEAEVQAYSLAKSAWEVFGTRVYGYWVARRAVGSQIPNEVEGRPAMVLSGITASSLVFRRQPGLAAEGLEKVAETVSADSVVRAPAADGLDRVTASSTSAAVTRAAGEGEDKITAASSADPSVSSPTAGALARAAAGVASDTLASAPQADALNGAEVGFDGAATTRAVGDAVVAGTVGAASDAALENPVTEAAVSETTGATASPSVLAPIADSSGVQDVGVLSDATSPPYAESFVDLLLVTGVDVFGDMVVVADADGFAELMDGVGVYGDAKWAVWAAHGYAAIIRYASAIRLVAKVASKIELESPLAVSVERSAIVAKGVSLEGEI